MCRAFKCIKKMMSPGYYGTTSCNGMCKHSSRCAIALIYRPKILVPSRDVRMFPIIKFPQTPTISHSATPPNPALQMCTVTHPIYSRITFTNHLSPLTVRLSPSIHSHLISSIFHTELFSLFVRAVSYVYFIQLI